MSEEAVVADTDLAATLGPLVSKIPQPVRDEIASVCTAVAAVTATLVTVLASVGQPKAAAVAGAVGGFASAVLGIVTRQSVTKTSAVAVDARQVTGPVVVARTLAPPSLGIQPTPQPTVQVTPLAPGAASVVSTDPVTGEVSASALPIAGSPEDDVPPLDPDVL
jgi:hypothetical protein